MSDFFAQSGMESIEELFSMITTVFIALVPLLYLFRLRTNRERKNQERRRQAEAEELALTRQRSESHETEENERPRSYEEPEATRAIGFLEALLTGQAPGTRVPTSTPEQTAENGRNRNQYNQDEDYLSPYEGEATLRPTQEPSKPAHEYAPTQVQEQKPLPAYRSRSVQSTRARAVRSVREGREPEDPNRPKLGFGFSAGLAETGIPTTPPVVSVASQRAQGRRNLRNLPEWQKGVVYAEILGPSRAVKKYSEDQF